MFRLSSGLRVGASTSLALFCCAVLSGQVITTTIGTDWVFPTQPMQAVRAPLGRVTGVALDPRGTGDMYISDASNNMVMRVTPAGVLTVVAGNGQPSPVQGNRDSPPGPLYSGDGGRATNASLSAPGGLAVDRAGNIYIADTSNDRIRKVSPNGIITTIVASKQPTGVAVDSAGNVFIAEKGTGSIVKVSPEGKVIGGAKITIVGEGPDCVATDVNGNAYSYAP